MAQLVLLNLTRGKSMATSQEEPIDNISIEQIVNIFCRINCNVFTITDDECVPVGVGLFLDGALFNHACDPNCVVSFQQQKMMVRTIQTVPKGQELSISYIDVFQSRKKRQQILASSYFFVCECDRCQHNLEEEDLQLDGFKCLNETCQGVVDAELRTCNTCNSTRSQQEINVLEATYYHEMELIKHSMGYDQTNAMAKAWNILTDRIVHKSNIRVAQVARELGDIALRAGVSCSLITSWIDG
jgi:SET and MYND domain-containing protein